MLEILPVSPIILKGGSETEGGGGTPEVAETVASFVKRRDRVMTRLEAISRWDLITDALGSKEAEKIRVLQRGGIQGRI